LVGGNICLQHFLGTQDEFFHGKFTTNKDAEALAEFYQAEDLLRIIAMHPIFFDLFMNKVEPVEGQPDEDGALLSTEETGFNVKLFGMEVAFEIHQVEEETEDGDTQITSFMRHERFIDWVPILYLLGKKALLWDQTWTYGFKRLEDGNIEVYHHGEKFVGPWPIRLIVFFHQYYVLWACRRFINGENFGSDDLDAQQEELACIPLHAFKKLVGSLEQKKKEEIEVMQKEPLVDDGDLAKANAQYQALKRLTSRRESSIMVAKREEPSTGMVRRKSMILIAKDEDTQQALRAAMKEPQVREAFQDAIVEAKQSGELEFKRRLSTRISSRVKPSQQTSDGGAPSTAPVLDEAVPVIAEVKKSGELEVKTQLSEEVTVQVQPSQTATDAPTVVPVLDDVAPATAESKKSGEIDVKKQLPEEISVQVQPSQKTVELAAAAVAPVSDEVAPATTEAKKCGELEVKKQLSEEVSVQVQPSHEAADLDAPAMAPVLDEAALATADAKKSGEFDVKKQPCQKSADADAPAVAPVVDAAA